MTECGSVLQLVVLQLGVHPEDQKGTSLKDLMKDPYILIAAGWTMQSGPKSEDAFSIAHIFKTLKQICITSLTKKIGSLFVYLFIYLLTYFFR